jgi:superfamily II DNA/RNA helicase
VALVVHADPPVEHKAYLHRSGRTARAGNSGTVVTLMTDAQVRDVRDLTRKAGIKPRITRLGAGHPLLAEIAPGERVLVTPPPTVGLPGRGEDGGGRRPRRSGAGSSRRTPASARSGRSESERSGRRDRGTAPTSVATSGRSGSGSAAAFSSAAGGRRRSR